MSKITKIIYIFLFAALILHPHITVDHISSISSKYVQSIINLIIVLIAYIIYILHSKELRQKESENTKIKKELISSDKKLSGSFKYIGRVNRRLALIKGLTTDLISRFDFNKKSKKNILNQLLNTAVASIAKTDWGMFRFINIENENTIKEVVYTKKDYVLLKTQISNKELLELRKKDNRIKKINDLHVMITTDYKNKIQCFIILPESKIEGADKSILQAIVDQAQLFYQYLYNNK